MLQVLHILPCLPIPRQEFGNVVDVVISDADMNVAQAKAHIRMLLKLEPIRTSKNARSTT
jgi:hypothetical protein